MRGSILCLAALSLAPAASAEEGGRLSLTVSEKAGIRRFGYPVYVKLQLPREVTAEDRFRLLADGKTVAAQFRSLAKAGEKQAVALDFTVSCGPLEKKTFTVEYGPDVTAGPEPKGGLTLEGAGGVYTVRSGGMAYVVDPAYRWVRSLKDGKREYLRAAKAVPKGERGTITVVREGPLAVCLRKEVPGPGGSEKRPLSATLEMTFPRSKSWVECTATLHDPDDVIREVFAAIPLLLEGKPALVDFGAGSGVYATLEKGQRAVLSAGGKGGRAWEVLTGDEKKLSPFVVPVPGATAKAEGWAHVMDSQRATAVAVDGFGLAEKDLIAVNGAGELLLERHFAKGHKGTKSHRFWLHFVRMPVQVGALTSPQSMQAPLAVEVKKAR